MKRYIVSRVHAPAELVGKHAHSLELVPERDDDRPVEANREHRMRKELPRVARVHVAWQQVIERSGIGHRPARIDFGDAQLR